ncbi:MAG: hypothetical protein ACLS90_00420 [Clostridia bacterium]|jgi:hypothetical protein|nr:MAG TPA: hypothetical protein [Caudoviricetes sp.]
MREIWEVEWEMKSRDGREIIGGIIRENSLKELESLMEIHKNRSIREKILMKAPEFGEIVKKKYE